MTRIPVRISLGIALLATIGYCWAVWYAGNLFAILVGPDGLQSISRFSQWTIMPLDVAMRFNMIHWQLLAAASLFMAAFAPYRAGRDAEPNSATALALVNHYGLLLVFVFVNMIGFGISFLAICYEIR